MFPLHRLCSALVCSDMHCIHYYRHKVKIKLCGVQLILRAGESFIICFFFRSIFHPRLRRRRNKNNLNHGQQSIYIYLFFFKVYVCLCTFRSVLDKQRPEWDVDFQSNCQVTSLIVGIAAMAQSRIQSIQSAERTLLDRLFLHGGGCIQHRAEPSTWLSYISNVDFRCFSFSKKKKTRHKEIRTGSRPFLLLAWIIAIY